MREDYSADGDAWHYFPHDHARSRAYRWNEDGLAGICDRHQFICFALALWNGRDPILKERLFGLTGPQGNHGEDVKEYYFYLDSTPTHSYMKWLYKYPQAAFPYARLVEENARRGRDAPEFELLDTGRLRRRSLLRRVRRVRQGVARRHPDPHHGREPRTGRRRDRRAADDLVPQPLVVAAGRRPAPPLSRGDAAAGIRTVVLDEEKYGRRYLYCDGAPELLFTNNETNTERLFGTPNATPYVKDGIHEYVVARQHGRGESGGHRHEVRRAVSRHDSRRRPRRVPPAADRRAHRRAVRAAVRPDLRRADRGGRRVLRRRDSRPRSATTAGA